MRKKLTSEEIKTLAIAQEERIVRIPFDESQLEKSRDIFIQNSIKLSALKEEFSNISSDYKIKIKEIEKAIKDNLTDIRNGYREKKAVCYLIDNQEEGIMEYYTEEGELVYSRPLRPDERQINLFKQLKGV